MATEYAKKTNAELIDILKSRSLPHTGKKADLVARLEESDRIAAEADAKSKTATPADSGTKADAADDVIDWDDDPAPVETTTTATTETEKATEAAAGGKGAAPNPAAVPNQQVDTDPSTTHDLNVVKPDDKEKKEEEQAAEAAATTGKAEEQNGAATEPAQEGAAPAEGEVPVAPEVDFSIGLAASDLDAELAKRKARAEKFGIVDDESAKEAQKAIERAKRFGIDTQGTTGGVKGLDEALPSERPRKRGRGGDEGNYGRGKRRDFHGRGRRRQGGNGGGRQQPRGGNQPRNGSGGQKSQWSDEDLAAMERRKARFG